METINTLAQNPQRLRGLTRQFVCCIDLQLHGVEEKMERTNVSNSQLAGPTNIQEKEIR
jgi:hypothetical protein